MKRVESDNMSDIRLKNFSLMFDFDIQIFYCQCPCPCPCLSISNSCQSMMNINMNCLLTWVTCSWVSLGQLVHCEDHQLLSSVGGLFWILQLTSRPQMVAFEAPVHLFKLPCILWHINIVRHTLFQRSVTLTEKKLSRMSVLHLGLTRFRPLVWYFLRFYLQAETTDFCLPCRIHGGS